MTRAKPQLPAWPRGMTASIAASYVGLSVTTLHREVAEGRFPKPFNMTAGRKAWLKDSLDEWLDRRAGVTPEAKGVTASAASDKDKWMQTL